MSLKFWCRCVLLVWVWKCLFMGFFVMVFLVDVIGVVFLVGKVVCGVVVFSFVGVCISKIIRCIVIFFVRI